MTSCIKIGIYSWLLSHGLIVAAQGLIRLTAIEPGTEAVQLIPNGDFQSVTPSSEGLQAAGWTSQGQLAPISGTNTSGANESQVAGGKVDLHYPVSLLQRLVHLEPNTSYVLSAYLWNMGDPANHVNTVVDFNDAPGEPQLVLSSSNSGADGGYSAYRSFNTATTGSNITLRLFYDGLTGTGASAGYYPLAAQWDNIAITKAVEFIPPTPHGTGGNLRPRVRIDNPNSDDSLFFPTLPASVLIDATATDYDGSIRQVELWLDATLLGTRTEAPYSWTWANATPGSHVLVAVAQDNLDARTSSAPVRITVTAPPQPVPLTINASGTNLTVSWPAPTVALSLQSTSNLTLNSGWSIDTNPPALQDNRYIVSVADHESHRFFRLGPGISPSTLEHKHLLGYQGWFGCPGDGSPVNQWIHWFRRGVPVATNATVDFWPDIRELSDEELYPTAMTLKDGSPARVYSAYNQKTVTRHFQWMKEHHLDGVFLQRFSSELSSPAFFALRNQVTENVRAGAESQGRVFAIMYDISGQPAPNVVSALTNDWHYLTGTLHLTNSPVYIQHRGKPVVAVWGFGFTDRAGTPEEAMTVIQFFKDAGCTVMGGVPTYWRTLTQDSRTNAAWAAVYRSFDIVSPWAVGRYGTVAEADTFKRNLIAPDLAETKKRGIDYMPVIFPGFSWHNLNGGRLNQIPRNGGAFYWRQAYNAVTAGCTMMYGAMFDEMDEGTAMLKMAPTANELPQQGAFVPLNIDGQNLPSDWYLRLADEATKMLRGDIPAKPQMPITPP